MATVAARQPWPVGVDMRDGGATWLRPEGGKKAARSVLATSAFQQSRELAFSQKRKSGEMLGFCCIWGDERRSSSLAGLKSK